MKAIIFLSAMCVLLPALNVGCSTAPAARMSQYQTLRDVGDTAKAALVLGGELFRDGALTPVQSRMVLDFHNGVFQPAYLQAVLDAGGDLTAFASPELLAVGTKLSSLVIEYRNKSKP